MDLYEALAWRRGALRYYIASTQIKQRIAKEEKQTQKERRPASSGHGGSGVATESALEVVPAAATDVAAAEGSDASPPANTASAAGAATAAAAAEPFPDLSDVSVTLPEESKPNPPAAAAPKPGVVVGAVGLRAGRAGLAVGCAARLERAYVSLHEVLLARYEPGSRVVDSSSGQESALRYGIYSTTHLLALGTRARPSRPAHDAARPCMPDDHQRACKTSHTCNTSLPHGCAWPCSR